jgi:hypothetical protein
MPSVEGTTGGSISSLDLKTAQERLDRLQRRHNNADQNPAFAQHSFTPDLGNTSSSNSPRRQPLALPTSASGGDAAVAVDRFGGSATPVMMMAVYTSYGQLLASLLPTRLPPALPELCSYDGRLLQAVRRHPSVLAFWRSYERLTDLQRATFGAALMSAAVVATRLAASTATTSSSSLPLSSVSPSDGQDRDSALSTRRPRGPYYAVQLLPVNDLEPSLRAQRDLSQLLVCACVHTCVCACARMCVHV